MSTLQEIYNEAVRNGKEAYIPYLTDKKMVKDIVDLDIMAFKYVPVEFKTLNFCLYACTKNCYAYLYVPKEYKTDKRILYATLSQWGEMLQYCPDSIKADPEYVIVAAKNTLKSLKFADPSIFENRDVAQTLVKYNFSAIISFPKFKNDVELCKGILDRHPDFRKYVGEDVIADYEERFLKLEYFHIDNANRGDDYWDKISDDDD